MLSKLGFIQRPRQNTKHHVLKALNDEQIKQINEYFNSPNYKSTLYNIVMLLKGSNPSGSLKKPKSSQLKVITDTYNYGINIFFHYFLKTERNEKTKEMWSDLEKYNVQKKDIEQYLNEFVFYKKILEKLNSNRTERETEELLDDIKLKLKTLDGDIKKIKEKSVKLYNEYSKKIKNIFNNKSEAFEKY
ncbi:MAG: hypothetical protein LBC39_08885 [Methanobrevibacter sp.]|nr:hypothetical protein [Candidatus Methanovirga aequatorialis]